MLVPSLCVGSQPRTHQHPAPPRRDTGPWHLHGQPSFEVHSSGQTRPWCVLLASPRAPPLPAPQGSHCHCRICYSDTSSPQEDQYPPNIAVKVNHSYCSVPVSGVPGQPWLCFVGGGGRAAWREGQGHRPPAALSCVSSQGYYPSNKPGVEPKRPCRPINLTHLMYLSSATNRITVTWGNYGKVSGAGPALLPTPSRPNIPFTRSPGLTPLPPLLPELLGGLVLGAAADVLGVAAEVENHRGQAPGAVQGAG